MSNTPTPRGFVAPSRLPPEITKARTWLVWRYIKVDGEKKPRKVPYYINGNVRKGEQGTAEDRHALTTFDNATQVAIKRGLDGIGLAMMADNEIIAVDFDNCVEPDGTIDPRVEDAIEGTYAEYSPSGTGVRAFFLGQIADRKDTKGHERGELDVEFFCAKGYVTVTGNVTPPTEMFDWYEAVPLTEAARKLYERHFGASSGALSLIDDSDFLSGVMPKVGLTLEKAKSLLDSIDPDCSRSEWLNALMALHHEFDGSKAALEVAVEWSSRAEKFAGREDVEGRWRSFGKRSGGAPITAAWLLRHSSDARAVEKYEAVTEWRDQIKVIESEFDLREKLCPKIAKDTRLEEIERESLAQMLMAKLKSMGTKVTIAYCRKLVASADSRVPTVKQKRPLTEFGNADRMLDKYGDSLMYVPETDSWYCWNGIYWRKTSDIEIQHYAKETIRALVNEYDEHEADAAEFFDFCKLSQQAKMVKNMVTIAASDPRVMVPASELDKHKALLCVQNGVVDLKTGALLASDPAYRMTRVCACDYVPEAKAPLFRKVLRDVFFGDEELIEYFLRLLGYSIIGDPTEDIMVIAHGNGSNGKSTVFGAIRNVLGSYAKSADAATFVSDTKSAGGGGPREDLLRLHGARFVYVNEPDENGELREGMVKSLSGGDSITARGLFARSSVEFEASFVAFMPTNHKPIVKGGDNGIWRRLVLIPFLRNFENDPEVEKDPNLAEKLAAETEGLLALIVLAARAYQAHGLSQPVVVRKAREEYRSQMDILSEWLEERCEFDAAYSETVTNLWKSWESFAKERGVLRYVSSSMALGKRLEQRFPTIKTTGGRREKAGLRLKVLQVLHDENLDGFWT